MTKVNINIKDLKPYINAGFENDNAIIDIYDKSQKVESIEDVCDNIYNKIKGEYEMSFAVGVENDDKPIGYYVCYKKTLVSFSLNIEYRTKENLIQFFDFIKKQFKDTFQILLYTYNERGISWLEKSGCKIIFENVTLLEYKQ